MRQALHCENLSVCDHTVIKNVNRKEIDIEQF